MATQDQQSGQNQQNRSLKSEELERGADKSTVQPAGKEAPKQDARQIKQAVSQNEDFNTDELEPDDMDFDQKEDWNQKDINIEIEKNPRH
ncbi:hypothetical protein [Bdellovibrio sp. KM01]|uniref:hypothetical protein n=1 Tax=Bdellovibrio sp. KM01 TaxID=2748865 RepID=UPI0015E8FC39|nr:hypothetical protein [Bdellovibrio sp. KM01]QLY23998.1 hypothetical protein HW988_10960 [Bdellovibrio sp. KM01]